MTFIFFCRGVSWAAGSETSPRNADNTDDMQGLEFSLFASVVKEVKVIAASEMRSAEWSPWCSARTLCTGGTGDDTEGMLCTGDTMESLCTSKPE